MKHAVFLDVDETLIITSTDKEENGKRYLNTELLAQLKLSKMTDLYLFTDMNLSDLEGIDDPNRITRKALVDQLRKKGFKVHAVITPADPALAEGIGAAYNSFYLPAYAKKIQGQDYQAEQAAFDANAKKLQVSAQFTDTTSAAGQKKAMFDYFLTQKPDDLKSILYFDDDTHCLDAVQHLAQKSNSIELITCLVDPNMRQPKIFLRDFNEENKKYAQKIALVKLKEYISLRKEERIKTKSQYNSFLGRLFSAGRDADSKISAAEKCLNLLQGNSVPFTKHELAAFKNGRLKSIIHHANLQDNLQEYPLLIIAHRPANKI